MTKMGIVAGAPHNSRRVGVVGLGLGYSFCHYIASRGHDVYGVDIDEKAISAPRLDEEMRLFIGKNRRKYLRRLRMGTGFKPLEDRDIIVIFVSTPLVEGRLTLDHVVAALKSATGVNQSATYLIFSTLPIGGIRKIHDEFPSQRILYTPPMVRRGMFLTTFTSPPSGWQLIGYSEPFPKNEVSLYKRWLAKGVKILPLEEKIVEAAKLVTNMFLSVKIVSANAVAGWLGDLEVARQVCKVVNLDPRVGEGYFTPGNAVGGPCLPRDMQELLSTSQGSPLAELLDTIIRLNGSAKLA